MVGVFCLELERGFVEEALSLPRGVSRSLERVLSLPRGSPRGQKK